MTEMRCSPRTLLLLLAVLLLAGPALAQQGHDDPDADTARSAGATGTNTSSRDRLFLNFIEDGMIVDEQWWEGWLQYDDSDLIDRTILFGQAAFQMWDSVEVGARVGFGSTDATSGVDDGTGATDLDLWGKYYWNIDNDRTEISAGAILTVPTGDDSVGLGTDAFALKGFGAMRYRLEPVILTGTLGVQMNDDGRTLGSPDLDGEIAFNVGLGVIAPWSDAFSFVGELTWNSNRFDGFDDDSRLLGGINLRLGNRGMLRPALALGLQDGAPDAQVYVGYAYSF
jgi:hypothetical protein